MKITIRGDELDLDPDSLSNRELMELERVTGLTFGQWMKALEDTSITALTAAVWLARRRKDPSLRIDDVEFTFGDVEVEGDAADPTDAGSTPGG